MRMDVAKLLDRLGRRDFTYEEFGEAFGDVEFWPIFEALLQDPRIYAPGEVAAVEAPIAAQPADIHAPVAEAAPSVTPPPAALPTIGANGKVPPALAALFARYTDPTAAPIEGESQDIRAILQRLADHLEKGDN